jgi:hypothetical protein
VELVKNEHKRIDEMSAAENKHEEGKEELSQVKDDVETRDDGSRVSDEKLSEQCVETAVSSEEKKVDGDGGGSKSEPVT